MKLLHSFQFPPEIEDEIFENAARLHLTYAPTLATISKRVQWVVEFIIYETIALDTRGSNSSIIHKFEATLNTRPPEFFARRVHNLCIANSVPAKFAEYTLSICTGVRNLAMWQSRGPDVEISCFVLPFSSTLRSLDTDRRTIDGLAVSGTVFPRLELLGILSWPDAIPVPPLHWLPAFRSITLHITSNVISVPTLFEDDWKTDIYTAMSSAVRLRHLQLEGVFELQNPDRAAKFLEIDVEGARVELTYRGYGEDVTGRLMRDYIGRWEDFCGVFKTRPPASLGSLDGGRPDGPTVAVEHHMYTSNTEFLA